MYASVAGFQHGVAVTVLLYMYLPGMEDGPSSIERGTVANAVASSMRK